MFGIEDFEGKLTCAFGNDVRNLEKFAWAEINE